MYTFIGEYYGKREYHISRVLTDGYRSIIVSGWDTPVASVTYAKMRKGQQFVRIGVEQATLPYQLEMTEEMVE